MLQYLLQNFTLDDFEMSNYDIGRGYYPRNHSSLYPQYSSFGNFSFPVDPDNQTLTRNLRTSSLTGHTPHPISRQLSRPRVPVENEIDHEETDTFAPATRPSRGTVPIPVEHETTPKALHRPANIATSNSIRTQHRPAGHNAQAYNEDVLNGFSSLGFHDTWSNRSLNNNFSSLDYDPTKYRDPTASQSQVTKQKAETKKTIENNKKSCQSPSKSEKTDKKKFSKWEEQEIEKKAQDDFIKEKYNLYRFHIIPDGNCLYRAVAQAVLLDQNQHEVLRQLTLEHIRENREEFTEIVEGDMEEFLTEAAREGVWAGYPETLAMSRWLDININITTGGSPSNRKITTTLHHFPSPNQKEVDGKISTKRQSIWLSWLSSGHYDALMDKVLENKEYDRWIESRDSRIASDEAIANQIYANDNQSSRDNFIYPRDTPQSTGYDRPPSYDSVVNQVPSTVPFNNQFESFWDMGNFNAPCRPFEYPPSNQSRPRSAGKPTSPPKPPSPPNNGPLIDHDEELAHALQHEEKFDLQIRSSYYV